MAAARGDTKPCTHAHCPGTMHFSREPLEEGVSGVTREGDRGWVCTDEAAHFERALEQDPQPSTVAQDRPA